MRLFETCVRRQSNINYLSEKRTSCIKSAVKSFIRTSPIKELCSAVSVILVMFPLMYTRYPLDDFKVELTIRMLRCLRHCTSMAQSCVDKRLLFVTDTSRPLSRLAYTLLPNPNWVINDARSRVKDAGIPPVNWIPAPVSILQFLIDRELFTSCIPVMARWTCALLNTASATHAIQLQYLATFILSDTFFHIYRYPNTLRLFIEIKLGYH